MSCIQNINLIYCNTDVININFVFFFTLIYAGIAIYTMYKMKTPIFVFLILPFIPALSVLYNQMSIYEVNNVETVYNATSQQFINSTSTVIYKQDISYESILLIIILFAISIIIGAYRVIEYFKV